MVTILLISSLFLWAVVILNLLLTLALIRRLNASVLRSRTLLPAGLKGGEQAPPFTAQTLDGQTKTLSDYTGRSTAFVFIAPECEPCRTLLPTLERVSPQARQSGAELVLICNGNEEQARTLIEQISITLPVLLAPSKDNPFLQDYQVHATPSYCVFNEHGRIQAAGHPGPHDQEWQKLLEAWPNQYTLPRGKS